MSRQTVALTRANTERDEELRDFEDQTAVQGDDPLQLELDLCLVGMIPIVMGGGAASILEQPAKISEINGSLQDCKDLSEAADENASTLSYVSGHQDMLPTPGFQHYGNHEVCNSIHKNYQTIRRAVDNLYETTTKYEDQVTSGQSVVEVFKRGFKKETDNAEYWKAKSTDIQQISEVLDLRDLPR
jgi:hypothetical protein